MAISFVCLAASEIKVLATVDNTKISLDEFVQFKITIEGITSSFKNPKINLPQLEENFDIVATSHSSNISMKSDKTNISWQMQYTLSPKKEGQIKIESAEVIFEGKSYKTDQIIIIITPSKKPQKKPQEKTPSKRVPWSEEGISI